LSAAYVSSGHRGGHRRRKPDRGAGRARLAGERAPLRRAGHHGLLRRQRAVPTRRFAGVYGRQALVPGFAAVARLAALLRLASGGGLTAGVLWSELETSSGPRPGDPSGGGRLARRSTEYSVVGCGHDV